jgi:hypothetical protein
MTIDLGETLTSTEEIRDLFATIVDPQAAFEELLEQAEPKSTIASRKAETARAITEFDLDYLLDLQDVAGALIDKITVNELNLRDGDLIPAELATALAQEFLDERKVGELLAARKEQIKAAVFAHITTELKAQGVKNPENTNGAIAVPSLGVEFQRYGCGPKTPTVNVEILKELLGEERFDEICTTVDVPERIVPAHTETVVSGEKIMLATQADPEILELVRQSLESGGWKSPSFTLRTVRNPS